jgi:hypothetical protein
MRRSFLGLMLAAMVHPANYGLPSIAAQKAALYQVKDQLPRPVPGKVISSENRLSQKSRRRRAKWSNKK